MDTSKEKTEPAYRLIIDIEAPCTEDFEAMAPTAAGALCSSCNKEVHDFRGKAPQYISDTVQAHRGKMCGIFDAPSTPLPSEKLAVPSYAFSDWRFVRKFALALFVVFGLQLFSSEAFAGHDIEKIRQSVMEVVDQPNKHYKVITGKVVDENTGESLPGATVYVWSDSTIVVGVSTDVEGNYHLGLTRQEWQALEKGELVVRFIGYDKVKLDGAQFEGQFHHIRNLKMNVAATTLTREVQIVAPFINRPIVMGGTCSVRYIEMREVEMIPSTDRGVHVILMDND